MKERSPKGGSHFKARASTLRLWAGPLAIIERERASERLKVMRAKSSRTRETAREGRARQCARGPSRERGSRWIRGVERASAQIVCHCWRVTRARRGAS